MAIESRTAISPTQIVLPKHDVEPAGFAGHSRQDGKRQQAKKAPQEDTSESHPISNDQGQITGILIDVTV